MRRRYGITIVVTVLVVVAVTVAFAELPQREEVSMVGSTGSFSAVAPNSTSVTNPTTKLQFSLQVISKTGGVTVNIEEFNPLDSVDHVNASNVWKFSPFELNPYNWCPTGLFYGFAITKGYYAINNYSTASPVGLYDTEGYQASCSTTYYGYYNYTFQPHSDNSNYPFNIDALLSDSINGYYTNSGATFQQFSPGVYTVIAADEWGDILLLHFKVVSVGL